jgi:precorrin-2 methylase
MKGILHIIGAGPGDPELLTIKAFHVLTENTDVVAYPGSAPCTGTAKLLMPLVSGNEPVQIFPSEDFELSFPGTLILLKVGRHLAQIKQKISDSGRTACLIENCGLPGERLYRSLQEMPEKTG